MADMFVVARLLGLGEQEAGDAVAIHNKNLKRSRQLATCQRILASSDVQYSGLPHALQASHSPFLYIHRTMYHVLRHRLCG
jgi:hypothetical protein